MIAAVLRNIPGKVGRKLRYWYYRGRFGSCGKRVVIDRNVFISNPKNVFVGDDVWIDQGVMILAGKPGAGRKLHMKTNAHYRFSPGELHIGNQVHISAQVILQAHGGISIGNQLTIGAGSKIYSLSHHYRNIDDAADQTPYYFGSMVPAANQYMVQGAVVISDKAAVGLNCVLLPGSYIPENTWLGVGMIISNQPLEAGNIYSVEQQHITKKRK